MAAEPSRTDMNTALSEHLLPGEKLLWSGQPQRIDRWRRLNTLPDRTGMSWITAIAAIGGAVAAVGYIVTTTEGRLLSWPAILAAAVLGLILYGSIRKIRIVISGLGTADSITYGVTDRRILFVDAGNQRSPQSINIDLLPEPGLSVSEDGLYTVVFWWKDIKAIGSLERAAVLNALSDGRPLTPAFSQAQAFRTAVEQAGFKVRRGGRQYPPRFENITDGPAVLRLVQNARDIAIRSAD